MEKIYNKLYIGIGTFCVGLLFILFDIRVQIGALLLGFGLTYAMINATGEDKK